MLYSEYYVGVQMIALKYVPHKNHKTNSETVQRSLDGVTGIVFNVNKNND